MRGFVCVCSRYADVTRFGNALKPSGDVHTVTKDVVPSIRMSPRLIPNSEEHTAVLRYALVAFGHHRLHGRRAFDRIDHRGKLKQHAVPRGLHKATAMPIAATGVSCRDQNHRGALQSLFSDKLPHRWRTVLQRLIKTDLRHPPHHLRRCGPSATTAPPAPRAAPVPGRTSGRARPPIAGTALPVDGS
jgi:hypothetical protein